MTDAVVVTGMGAVSAVGSTTLALWEALAAGTDGMRQIDRFALEGIPTLLGGLVPGFDDPRAEPRAHHGLSVVFAITAAREAWMHARAAAAPHRIALVLGTSIGDDLHDATPLDAVTQAVGDALGVAGPRITVSTACASSTNAVGLAADLLADGSADVVIAGGTDVLTPEIYAGFHGVGVLSATKCAPFSEPFGATLGEGAGFVVLERATEACERGATILACIAGYGLSADAFHETSPDPSGAGVARAIDAALQNSQLGPTDIGYVNAHGTGTEANDPAEWRALVRVLGDHAHRIPVSATKSLLGHAQGAAGILETITTIIAMRQHVIPQTLHFTRPRANAPSDPVGAHLPRPGRFTRALCTSSAFGGANAVLVVTDEPTSIAPVTRRDVFVQGVGAVGAHGTTLDELDTVLARCGPLSSLDARPFALETILPTASPRGLNPTTRFLTAAAALALADSGLKLRKQERERTGIFVGTTEVSPETAAEFRASITQRGFAQLSAAAFARMVVNASTGACSKLIGCKGPTSTLTTGDGSGLIAIAYAARWLAVRRDTDVLLAAGVDEIDRDRGRGSVGEGAACAVLGTTGTVRIAGWNIGAPGRFADTSRAALINARLRADDVEATFGDVPPARRHVDPRTVLGYAPASSDVFAFVAAVHALRRGLIRVALIGHASGTAATCALVLTSEPRHGP